MGGFSDGILRAALGGLGVLVMIMVTGLTRVKVFGQV